MPKQTWKGSALLSPVPPVMVTCGTFEKANIITVAWSGIINTQPPMLYISVRPQRYSYGIIKESGEFVVNLTTSPLVRAVDYCGTFTGAKVDKFEKCRLTKESSENVACPRIAQSPLSMECKVREVVKLGTHDMFIASIVSVSVDTGLLSADGKLKLDRAGLLAYAHGDYYELGKKLGAIGFSATKKGAAKK